MTHSQILTVCICCICTLFLTSEPLYAANCKKGMELKSLVNTVGVAIREAQRAESADIKPKMNIMGVTISVIQMAKENDEGSIAFTIPVFSSLEAAVSFSSSEASTITQVLNFNVGSIPVSAPTLSTNLIKAINAAKDAMRHASMTSKYLTPHRMTFSQDFEVICSTEKKASIVLLGYEGADEGGRSNSITFELEVDR